MSEAMFSPVPDDEFAERATDTSQVESEQARVALASRPDSDAAARLLRRG